MARRKGRNNRRKTPKKQPINLTKAAEALIVSNAATKTLFGTNLDHFLLDGWFPFGDYKDGLVSGAQGGSGNSWSLSLIELAGGITGLGSYRQSSSYPMANTMGGVLTAIGNNFKRNGATGLITIIGTPIAFKLGKKVLREPIRFTNKAIKMVGLNKEVRV